MKENMLIVGGSRGIGLAVAEYYHDKVENLICVSKNPSKFGKWIEADISQQQGIDKIVAAFNTGHLAETVEAPHHICTRIGVGMNTSSM